jgi:hypothetical protein
VSRAQLLKWYDPLIAVAIGLPMAGFVYGVRRCTPANGLYDCTGWGLIGILGAIFDIPAWLEVRDLEMIGLVLIACALAWALLAALRLRRTGQ